MAFTTPAWSNDRRWSAAWAMAALWLLSWGPSVQAESEFAVRAVDTYLSGKVYHLDAEIDYTLTPEVLEALQNGVPLNMQVSIEVYRDRRWWWDEDIASLTQRYRVQYHALTERYVVENLNSGAPETFTSLRAALRALGRIRRLPLLDQNLLEAGEDYRARMRVELDIEALPAPLRPLAYLSSHWRLGSEWYDWSLTD